jgi:uncharacterized protein (TIGR02099 family)
MKRILEMLAWATFFTCAAALLVLRYGLLPQIERYRPEIVARVAATVGQPVKIGRIEAEWLGLRPQINLSDVRIYDAEGREALVLPSVENILSWRWLAHGTLHLHALRIDGPRLTIRRDSAGAFYVAGIKLQPSEEAGFSDWLLGQEEIEVRNAEIEWLDEQRAAAPLTLSALNLRLKNDGQHHSLGLAGRLPEALGTTLELRAELAGRSLAQVAGWSGQAYAELGYTDLAAWRPWFDYPFELRDGQGAVRFWTKIEGGELREATADVALAGVTAKLGAELPPLALGSLSGRLQARLFPDGYQLTARKLALAPKGGAALAPVDFQLAWKAESGVVSANTLELAPLAHFAEALPLPADVRRLALELQPRGQLGDVRFEWQGAFAAPAQYRARARFFDLGIKPRETLPGFARLAGSVEATEAGGRLYLQSRNAQLELPRVFPEPRLAFETLNGQLDWKRAGGLLSVQVASLTFANADLSGNAFGSYAYDGEGPGELDVSAVLNRADAKNLAHYLPLGALMGDKPRQWLVNGILAGHASEVELRLKGNLRDFPFKDPARGQFLVTARVHGGLLHYAEGWPRIEDIEAELTFERNRMDVIGRAGRILGTSLHDVKVSMAELRGGAQRVQLTGQAQGPTAEFLKFLQSSPLRTSAGRFTESMSATGEGRLHLKLELPLADLAKTRVAGEYELVANQLVLHRVLPPLEQARGKLAFTESSFAVREARGQIFGGPVSITGGTRASGAVEFVARGEAQPAALGPLFDHPLRRFLTGSSPYVASVSLREGLQRVVVDSSLRGVTSALPPPLEKAPADALPLHVEFVPAAGGARDRISISLSRVAAAEILRRREGEEMQVQRAALSLTPAGQSIRLPERPGVLVYGSLAALDADRWRAVLPPGGGTLPSSVELRLGRLDIHGKRVHNLSLRGSADPAGWSAVVDADEIAGQLSYTAAGTGQLVARLLHFSVPRTVGAPAASAATPADLPAIDFSADRFNLRGKQLGKVELTAHRDGEDWFIEKLAMANPDATLAASGRWRGGVAPASELDFRLDAADVGKFLARVGYPGTVLGAKAELAGTVRWQGEPMTLDYSSLSGDLKLGAEDGQFLEIDPGLGKLISLMNLQALPRRIALDFRDVFSKGFRFDRIDAVSHLERGTMQLSEFRMAGPAAEVTMSGKVDLAHETQDLRLRVVPSLGGTASTALAIVNPVAGVAAAVAQRMLRNPLGQIFAHEFEVSGGWTDPKVAKRDSSPAPNEAGTP